MNYKYCTALLIMAFSPMAQASLLVYESFNYDGIVADGATLNGVTATGTGITGAYSVSNSGSGGLTGATIYQTTGLTFGSYQTTGGAVNLTATNSAASGTAASNLGVGIATTAATTGTLYSSYLFNISTMGTAAGSSLIQRTNTAINGGGGTSSLQSAAESSSIGISGITYNTAAFGTAASALSANTTYLALSKFTRVGQPTNVTNGTADMWVFTLTDYNAWIAAGGTEGLLGSYATFTASSAPYSNSGSVPFSNTKFIQLVAGAAVGDIQSGTFDEMRYGTTLGDVMLTAVPEPSMWSLLMAAATMTLIFRRRSTLG